jgi:hypothetical protein
VINAGDQWAWITEGDGMWTKSKIYRMQLPNESTRLVSFSLRGVFGLRFDPVIDALMAPAANDEECII